MFCNISFSCVFCSSMLPESLTVEALLNLCFPFGLFVLGSELDFILPLLRFYLNLLFLDFLLPPFFSASCFFSGGSNRLFRGDFRPGGPDFSF